MATACLNGLVPCLELQKWYVLQVRIRDQSIAATSLRDRGFEVFTPTYRARRIWSDRRVEIEQHLFPGYIFCRFDPADRSTRVIDASGVLRIVSFGDRPTPVDEDELAAVRLIVASGLPTQSHPMLRAGAALRMEHGPFAGMKGHLVQMKGRNRVVVNITLLHRSLSVEVDSAWISATSAT